MLYALCLHNIIGQLYHNRTGKKIKRGHLLLTRGYRKLIQHSLYLQLWEMQLEKERTG